MSEKLFTTPVVEGVPGGYYLIVYEQDVLQYHDTPFWNYRKKRQTGVSYTHTRTHTHAHARTHTHTHTHSASLISASELDKIHCVFRWVRPNLNAQSAHRLIS
jgi:hypothetical protein